MWAVGWLLRGCSTPEASCPPGSELDPEALAEDAHRCVDSEGRAQGLYGLYNEDRLVELATYRDGQPVGLGWKHFEDVDGRRYTIAQLFRSNGDGEISHLMRREDSQLVLSIDRDLTTKEMTMTWHAEDGPQKTVWREPGRFEPGIGIDASADIDLPEDGFYLLDVNPALKRAAWLEFTHGPGDKPLVDCGYPRMEGRPGGLGLGVWDDGEVSHFEIYAPASRPEDCTPDEQGERQLKESSLRVSMLGLKRDRPRPPSVPSVSLEVGFVKKGPLTDVETTLFGCPCLVGRWEGMGGPAVVYPSPPGESPDLMVLEGVWQEGGAAMAHVKTRSRRGYRHSFVLLR